MTKYQDIFASLAAQFHPNEVKTRAQAGRQLSYITARTAMNRLDNVLGGENWWDEYVPQENSVLCRLTIRFPDGLLVTKCDAGGYAGMADSGDDDKSGYSDAFKRAAVKFGVGRYLYRDGVPEYGTEHAEGPQRPQQAPPQRQQANSQPQRQQSHQEPQERRQDNNSEPRKFDGPPRNGRGLFAWVKEREAEHDIQLLKYLNGWAKLQDFPGRMVDWGSDQVERAHAEALRKIASVTEPPAPVYPMPVMTADGDEPQDEDIPF